MSGGLASEMSALEVVRGTPQGREDGRDCVSRDRPGAGDEGARSHFTGDGEADQLVAGGADPAPLAAADAAVVLAIQELWLRWTLWSADVSAESTTGAAGGGRRSPAAGFSVQHFHEKLREEHGLELSYTWGGPRRRSCARLLRPARSCGAWGFSLPPRFSTGRPISFKYLLQFDNPCASMRHEVAILYPETSPAGRRALRHLSHPESPAIAPNLFRMYSYASAALQPH